MKLSGWRLNLVRGIIFSVVILLTVLLFINRGQVAKLNALGYPGIFLISLLSNATLILPVPGVLFTSAMGALFNPWWVALAAGSGATIGELSGYLAGFSGQAVVENRKWYDRVSGWMKKYGDVTILFLAFVPNPLFDIAGMVAGALKMPLWRFLLWSWIGKFIKMLIFAFGGATILGFLK
ncbi:MAG: VTT domain-containing protein [Chloroflexi bacterium]|nr:VTT domain-containing protein [Chloroflexota bacterium]